MFAGGVIAVLSDYPVAVVRRVVDPRHGIPSRSKWLPTIAELKEACELEMAPIRREQERERRRADTQRALAAPEEERARRPSYAELQRRCAADGLVIGPKVPEPVRERDAALRHLREAFGATDAQLAEIPNAPVRR